MNDTQFGFGPTQLKTTLSFLLFLPLAVQSAELVRVKNAELAMTLSFLTELSQNNGVRIFSAQVAAAECWGTVKSCPDVRLFVVDSPEALYQEATLYQLPNSKGWEFVRWDKSRSFVLRTTLPDANIEPSERAKWKATEYLVTISRDGASFESR